MQRIEHKFVVVGSQAIIPQDMRGRVVGFFGQGVLIQWDGRGAQARYTWAAARERGIEFYEA